MRTFILAVLLWTLALSPVQAASAAPLQADDVVACQKAEVADIIVVAIKTSKGYSYACANGTNKEDGNPSWRGVTQGDVDFVVKDFLAHQAWAFGTDEKPSGVWYAVHRVGEPLGQHLKMVKWQP